MHTVEDTFGRTIKSTQLKRKLIRNLSIMPDLIFYPNRPCKDPEIEDLVRILYNYDERPVKVVRAIVKALDTYEE